MTIRYFITIWLLSMAPNLFAGEVGRVDITDKKASLVIKTADEKLNGLPLNKMVPLVVEIQRPTGEASDGSIKFTGFDAQMPEHAHGMVVTPKITPLDGERWRVDGVKLHMIGIWEISLFCEIDGKDRRYTVKVTL